ncbi:sulfurtransferase complex subunit TusC [Sodalis sp. CWE]|uniref:sulfurtransferase complex subunit TusC n=1 Tax=Sodalis sp. CWE TaxID=2803816 RepID=UPI001C7DB97D|nr:sulfurtransferase complex subunit TusC [Sodalis sp. CWE]MBX4180734.1 sulfurtransferase complex subunit TusC [Sodalis sp. CWE]
MNRIAFIFTHGPYRDESGREGLDLLLTTVSLSEEVGIFFIADGVFLLLPHQQPSQILTRNFIVTFNILSFYDINGIYLCSKSAEERGLHNHTKWILNVKRLSPKRWYQKLTFYNTILTF